MIQRIQSLYILLTIILLFMWYFMPLASIVDIEYTYNFSLYGIKDIANDYWFFHTIWISVLATLTMVVAMLSLFMYKNRKLQIKLSQLLLLLNTCLVSLAFLMIDKSKAAFGRADVTTADYKIAMVFPLIAVVFIFLAIKAIKKDEELVRSADRLR
jgi:hypothetical protein